MSKYYWVCADCINDYEEYEYEIGENISSRNEMIEEIKHNLKCLGGGHADIFNEDGDFVEDVEV